MLEYSCLIFGILGSLLLQMMMKTFTLWVACALPMIAPLAAHEGGEEIAKIQKDRERLIDLIIKLEADFGTTLSDYGKLQKEYAALLNRPMAKDQSGKVKELQKQLAATTAKLKSAESKQIDANAHALLEQDLVNLRNELHRERQDLLVAKAQLLRVQQLEKKSQDLEASLKNETEKNSKVMGELQAVRGERDALLGKIKGLIARAEKAEKGHQKANVRISELEKEANTLKLKVQGQEVDLRKLRVEQAHSKGAMAAAADLKKEQNRLTELLTTKENELNDLRADLAAEMKRSLDVPVLIKARDELKEKLASSNANSEALKKKNKTLTEKQTQLQTKIEKVQKSISSMQGELAKNKSAMAKVTKLDAENKTLAAERDALNNTIAMAKEELVKSRSLLQTTEAKLAESLKESKKAVELEKKNKDLLGQIDKHKTQVAAAKADLGSLQKKMSQNQTAMKAAAELGQKVEVLTGERDLLNSKLNEAKAAHLKAEENLKKAKLDLAKKAEMSAATKKAMAESEALRKSLEVSKVALKKAEEQAANADRLKKDYAALTTSVSAMTKEKATLSGEVARKDNELKKMRAEMASKPDMSEDLAKLEKEKKKLSDDLKKREADLKKTRDELGRLQLSASVATKQLDAIKRETAKIDPVRYAKGEADVTTQQARVLTQVQKVLQLFPNARFEIIGHTCDLGSEEGNLRLSQQRAKALQDFLIEKGVKEDRLKSRGVGLAEPIVPNTSEANRRQNRRVVVEILD